MMMVHNNIEIGARQRFTQIMAEWRMEWQNGGIADRNGGMEDGMAEWRNGGWNGRMADGMAEWWKGMVEWLNGENG
jgi:hypothetical protein